MNTFAEASPSEKPVNEQVPSRKRSFNYGAVAAGAVLITANVISFAVISGSGFAVLNFDIFDAAGIWPAIALVATWIFCRSWRQCAIWSVSFALVVGAIVATTASQVVAVEVQAFEEQTERDEQQATYEAEQAEQAESCRALATKIETLHELVTHTAPEWLYYAYPEDTWRGDHEMQYNTALGYYDLTCR